jgi:short-subunit dehydrogenase
MAYVLSFSLALSEEVRGTGVTVTALCPGVTETGFQGRAKMQESRLVAGRRMQGAREVAEYWYRHDGRQAAGRGGHEEPDPRPSEPASCRGPTPPESR